MNFFRYTTFMLKNRIFRSLVSAEAIVSSLLNLVLLVMLSAPGIDLAPHMQKRNAIVLVIAFFLLAVSFLVNAVVRFYEDRATLLKIIGFTKTDFALLLFLFFASEAATASGVVFLLARRSYWPLRWYAALVICAALVALTAVFIFCFRWLQRISKTKNKKIKRNHSALLRFPPIAYLLKDAKEARGSAIGLFDMIFTFILIGLFALIQMHIFIASYILCVVPALMIYDLYTVEARNKLLLKMLKISKKSLFQHKLLFPVVFNALALILYWLLNSIVNEPPGLIEGAILLLIALYGLTMHVAVGLLCRRKFPDLSKSYFYVRMILAIAPVISLAFLGSELLRARNHKSEMEENGCWK